MKSPYNIINVIGIVVAIALLSGDVLSARAPVIKTFEVDEFNNVIKPYDQVDGKRSEIVVEKVRNIRLECHSDYPVQWIYTGNGIPIINTDISRESILSTTDRRNNGRNGFVASIFLGSLKEQHSGQYQCSRTDYVTVVPNLYVYVPGQDLFTSTQGKTVQINPDVTSTTVPCTVSDPRIKVSLFKLDGNVLKRPVTKADDAIIYDPRKGFRINLRKIEDPEGRYLCTAYHNDDIRDVEYTIASSVRTDDIHSNAPAVAANYEEFKKPKEETCTGDDCKQCQTHTDCPPNMNCYTDFKCRDPCEYSIRCGTAAMCRIVENRPKCYCPSGFVGDATKECLNISRERYERYERYP